MPGHDYDPFAKPVPRVERPPELLFDFSRLSDCAPIRCDLKFHGEDYGGWEARFFNRGELFFSRGGFAMKADAVAWAEEMRPTVEKGGALGRGNPGFWGRRCYLYATSPRWERLRLCQMTSKIGVGDGYRTRDLLSHSQAFYH